MNKKTNQDTNTNLIDKSAQFNDFFTQFLDKRKKYFVNKLDEITQLEKLTTLKPEQKDKIANKQQAIDKVKYFDEIRELYSEASTKNIKKNTLNNTEVFTLVASDFVDLLTASQILQTNINSNGVIDKQIQQEINQLNKSLLSINLYKNSHEVKDKLSQFINNQKNKQAIQKIIQFEPMFESKVENKKIFLFSMSDEEIGKKKDNYGNDNTINDGLLFVPLPENEEPTVEEFIKVGGQRFFKKKHFNKNYKSKETEIVKDTVEKIGDHESKEKFRNAFKKKTDNLIENKKIE